MSAIVSLDFAKIAALWESRPERLEAVTDQVMEIHAKLMEWNMETESEQDLDHATIAFSQVVQSYECCEWLPFHLVPNWEDDLFCVLMDEDRWRKYRNVGRDTSKLADRLRRTLAKEAA